MCYRVYELGPIQAPGRGVFCNSLRKYIKKWYIIVVNKAIKKACRSGVKKKENKYV
jgi:hypothetical protein